MRRMIYVVDDSEGMRVVLTRSLETPETHVVGIGDPRDALRLIRRCPPDLLILDLSMSGQRGDELCAALKAEPRTAGIPVLMLTGSAREEAREAAARGGADAFLTKPFNLKLLKSAVEGLLGDAAGGAGPRGAPLLACAAALLLLSGCAGAPSRVHEGRVDSVIDQSPRGIRYFQTIGIGASDPALPTETQRRALARDAAIVKAQYELLAMLKGVTLQGGITVKRALEADSTLETRLRAAVRGAEVVKSEFTDDHGCVVTIRLPKWRVEELLAGVLP